METKKRKLPSIKDSKNKFLNLLKKNNSITETLVESNLMEERFFFALKNDPDFLRAFDEIINFKLEVAFLETVLKSKTPTLITFALSSRLGEKYSKNKPVSEEETAAQIIFEERTNE